VPFVVDVEPVLDGMFLEICDVSGEVDCCHGRSG
jgi:hypothetical protein